MRPIAAFRTDPASLVVRVDGRACPTGAPAGADALPFAIATLANALCVHAPRSLRLEGPVDLVRDALRELRNRPGTAELLGLAARLRGVPDVLAADPAPEAPRARRQARAGARTLGIDIGGTDGKAVVLHGDRVRHRAVRPWQVPLDCVRRAEDFPALVRDLAREALAAAGPVDAIGLSWPDVVVDDEIMGGLGSKSFGLRDALGPGWREAFDAHVRPLGRDLSAAFGVPVAVCNDGTAAAVWAAAAAGPGVLCLSLGTSVAGGLVDRGGAARGVPVYVSALVVHPGAGLPHRTTGLQGTLQQLVSQAAAFRLTGPDGAFYVPAEGPAHERLKAVAASEAARGAFAEMGRALADGVAELRFWLPDAFDRVVVFGRVVEDPLAGSALLSVPSPVPLIAARALDTPWDADPQTLGQAVGAALLARERA